MCAVSIYGAKECSATQKLWETLPEGKEGVTKIDVGSSTSHCAELAVDLS